MSDGGGGAASTAAGLRRDAERFLKGFGLLVAVWVGMLALAAPDVERPEVLAIGVGLTFVWALVALLPMNPWGWGSGWLIVAVGLELLGPASGTAGWSVTGGSALLVIAAATLTQRRHVVVVVVSALSVAVLGRGLFVADHTIGGSLGTLAIFGFSAVSLWWLVRTVLAGEVDRERLRTAVARAEAEKQFAVRRAESAARLHDSVLQSLASIHRADDLGEARDHAERASSQLRAWIRDRTPSGGGATLRRAVEHAAIEAGAGRTGFSASGDATLDATGRLLVDAVAEAVRNAVAHTTQDVRVFLEVRGGTATAWVADRGAGFDPQEAPGDRHGVRQSIVGRLERAGGAASLTSSDEGSEWCLRVPVATLSPSSGLNATTGPPNEVA